MAREYPDCIIEEFLCAGPKQYALKMRHRHTGEVKYVLKVRGITLDYQTCSRLNYGVFKRKVLRMMTHSGATPPAPIALHYERIQPTKHSRIREFVQEKTYEPFNQKGIITPAGQVLPFGYKR